MSDTNQPVTAPGGALNDFETLIKAAENFGFGIADTHKTLINITKSLEDHYDVVLKEIELAEVHAQSLIKAAENSATTLITGIESNLADLVNSINAERDSKVDAARSAANAIAAMLKDLSGPVQNAQG